MSILNAIMIGSTLKKIRIIRKISQVQVASKVGISKAYLSQIESNDRRLKVDLLYEICKVLEIKPTIVFILAESYQNPNEYTTSRLISEIKASIDPLKSQLDLLEKS